MEEALEEEDFTDPTQTGILISLIETNKGLTDWKNLEGIIKDPELSLHWANWAKIYLNELMAWDKKLSLETK